ncbi:MAG: hypothetical protein ABFD92_01310 [Planctomycetaceae bacterium]|nr:DUF4175 domain-containing protein [Planctomycetaceae bacterium]
MHRGSINETGRPRRDYGRWAILLAAAQFVGVSIVAMAMYPGGHPWDPQAAGYSFWRNTISDLTKSAANNGQPNPAYVAFLASLAVLAAGMAVAWFRLPRWFPRWRRLGSTCRVLGAVSVAGMIWLAAAPADTAPHQHVLAIAASAGPGLASVALACGAMFLDRACPRWWAVFTLGMLVVSTVSFTHYVHHFWLDGQWPPAAPAVEKLAALYVLTWLTLSAVIQPRRGAAFEAV